MKGMSIGSILLTFIKRYFTADNKTGCRFLTVDAYAAAIPFYLKNGFVPLNDEDADAPNRDATAGDEGQTLTLSSGWSAL